VVYLEWFRRSLLLKCVLQPEIAKNLLKTPIFNRQTVRITIPNTRLAVSAIAGKNVTTTAAYSRVVSDKETGALNPYWHNDMT